MKWIHITYIIYNIRIHNINICECRTHAEPLGRGVRGCEAVMTAARSRVYTGPCVRACKHGHVDGPKTVPYLFEYRVVQVAAQKPSLTAN